MLSTEYRLRLEYICNRISKGEEVKLKDMIWADKLARANRSAGEMLRKARRHAANPDMVEGSIAKILRKYFFRDTGTGKYYVVGSYSEEEALELLGDIDIGIKNRAEVVPEEEVPQNNAP